MSDASYTVLIVDDSAVNRMFLAEILEEDGYRILQAEDGESGIAKAAAQKPVLILLDVNMPGIDGFETLKRLKADPLTKRSAVIMLTSQGDQASKLKAFDYGAVDYIIKSANEAEVRARVRVHVRLARASEELIEARAQSLKQIAAAQRSLLVKPADLPEAKFAVYYRSLHEAGGDFFDVVPVSEGVFFYLMADVAGHDVGTSYVTPAVKVLLKQCATPAHSVEESMAYMNGVLSKTILTENYLTAFALRVNRRAGKAVYCSAGHPPALYLPREGEARLLEGENPFVGMVEDSSYGAVALDIREGDRFILYTDGLVERGAEKKSWQAAMDKLVATADGLRGLPLGKLPEALVRGMGTASQDDDIAVLAVEI
mgnify:CR=1 FL=1